MDKYKLKFENNNSKYIQIYNHIKQLIVQGQIKEHEKELNQTLFIRTKKNISLTKEGELFISFARDTLKNYQKCQNDMIIDQNIGGKLKIGLYWMFGYNGLVK